MDSIAVTLWCLSSPSVVVVVPTKQQLKIIMSQLSKRHLKFNTRFILWLALGTLLIRVVWQSDNLMMATLNSRNSSISCLHASVLPKPELIAYDSSPACLELPQVHASGVFFLNTKGIHQVQTIPEVQPPFFFGTMFGNANRVAYHMSDDIPYFDLIKEAFQQQQQTLNEQQQRLASLTNDNKNNNNNNSSSSDHQPAPWIALDVGANQGFYTWFLATLGMEVHSFEIQPQNFDALQHGIVFNPKVVADRAHLYPLGLSSTIGRVGQSNGGSYTAHIAKSDDGNILTMTMDCWAQHVQVPFRTAESNSSSSLSPAEPKTAAGLLFPVQAVKVDVEGFEIAVLQGAHQSLLHHKGQVGVFMIEVAPYRWSVAGISLETGIQELTRLQTDLFEHTYLMVRGDKECPYDIATTSIPQGAVPRLLTRNVQMHAIPTPEILGAILTTMGQNRASCNLWFSNHPPSPET